MTDASDIPLREYDPDPRSMIDPRATIPPMDVPEHVVLCFFQDAIERLVELHRPQVVRELASEDLRVPVYVLDRPDGRVVVVQPRVGAPLAAATMEACISMGGRTFLACGGCGVLAPLASGHLIVPSAALRDEGTSYHYQPPARWIRPDAEAVATVCSVLSEKGVAHEVGRVWTTDAYYRETRAKVTRRRAEGCIAVEMECAAFCAVARFRGVRFAQILYAGDSLAGEHWDHRQWNTRTDVRESLLELAIEACLRM